MLENQVALKNPNVTIMLDVLHKPGAVRLDGYPLLVYAPFEHGEGIRTEDNGTLVSDIVKSLAGNPDTKAAAVNFKTTEEHIKQALQYATATAAVRAPEK